MKLTLISHRCYHPLGIQKNVLGDLVTNLFAKLCYKTVATHDAWSQYLIRTVFLSETSARLFIFVNHVKKRSYKLTH